MPEELTGTAPETVPAEVIVAAAEPESQPESPEVQVERFTVASTFAPPSANDDARTIDAVWYTGAKVRTPDLGPVISELFRKLG
jgi:hypothetical protein